MGEKALQLNPNGAEAAAFLALALTYSGDHERSISLADHAINLSPYDAPWYDWILGRAYRLAGRYEDAIAVLSRQLEHNTGPIWPHIELACSYAELGLTEETKAVVTRIMTIDPGYSIADWTAAPSYADPMMSKREAEVLRKAGLPE
jgi:adenylate cyclase